MGSGLAFCHLPMGKWQKARPDPATKARPDPATLRAPPPRLRSSSPPRSPPPGTACRDAVTVESSPIRLRREPQCIHKAVSGPLAARLRGAEERRSRGRARSALRHQTRRPCLSAVSDSERSELGAGPRDRAPQGSRPAGSTASSKRRQRPGHGFAAPTNPVSTGTVPWARWNDEQFRMPPRRPAMKPAISRARS